MVDGVPPRMVAVERMATGDHACLDFEGCGHVPEGDGCERPPAAEGYERRPAEECETLPAAGTVRVEARVETVVGAGRGARRDGGRTAGRGGRRCDRLCDRVRDDGRWSLRAAYITAGLARGERVLLFTCPDITAAQAVARLTDHGVPARRARADGRLRITHQVPGYHPARVFDSAARIRYWTTSLDHALAGGYTGLRVAADMSWAGLPGVDGHELAAYEEQLGPLFEQPGFTAICEYDRALFAPDVLARLRAAHPLCVPPSQDELYAVREGGALRLAGVADLATRPAFEQTLREAAPAFLPVLDPGPALALIDLTGLSFIDAYCARTLLLLAADGRLPAGLTVRCTAHQYRTLYLCGAGDGDGLAFRIA